MAISVPAIMNQNARNARNARKSEPGALVESILEAHKELIAEGFTELVDRGPITEIQQRILDTLKGFPSRLLVSIPPKDIIHLAILIARKG